MKDDEELRISKKKPGSHRPKSKSSDGWDRDLWQGDENNETQGPSESRSADEVLAELEAAKTTKRRLAEAEAEREAAELRAEQVAAELKAEREAAESNSLSTNEPPSVGELLFKAAVEAIFEAGVTVLEEALSSPEGRRALLDTGRGAIRGVTNWGRRLLGLEPRTQVAAELVSQPPVTQESIEPSDPPARMEASPGEHPRSKMSRDEYREQLLTYMAFAEATSRIRESLEDVEVDDPDLPPELETAIQAALTGEVTQLSPEVRDLLLAFLVPTSLEISWWS